MIGITDLPPPGDDRPMIDPIGTSLKEEELGLLSNLLEKMLKYRPEERITIQEVLQHPWFEYAEVAVHVRNPPPMPMRGSYRPPVHLPPRIMANLAEFPSLVGSRPSLRVVFSEGVASYTYISADQV